MGRRKDRRKRPGRGALWLADSSCVCLLCGARTHPGSVLAGERPETAHSLLKHPGNGERFLHMSVEAEMEHDKGNVMKS